MTRDSSEAQVLCEIDHLSTKGIENLAFVQGERTKQYARQGFRDIPSIDFIDVGDYVGPALQRCAEHSMRTVMVVSMLGKMAEIAHGRLITRAPGRLVADMVARMVMDIKGNEKLSKDIRMANTAREVLLMCQDAGLDEIPSLICRRAVEKCSAHVNNRLDLYGTYTLF